MSDIDRATEYLKKKTQEVREEPARRQFEDAINRTPVADQTPTTGRRGDGDTAAEALADLMKEIG